MKWDTYKKMSAADKEEWTWRFKEKLEHPRVSNWATTYLMAMTIFVFIWYLAVTHPELKFQVLNYGGLILRISFAFIVVYGIDYLGQLVLYIYTTIKEFRWLKERGYK